MPGISDVGQMVTLLRISTSLDVVGDLTVTVANPADLVAWTYVLDEPVVAAWRASDSGHRFVQLAAHSHSGPVHGQITAVLECDAQPEFWSALLPNADLEPGDELLLTPGRLADAWVASAAPDIG